MALYTMPRQQETDLLMLTSEWLGDFSNNEGVHRHHFSPPSPQIKHRGTYQGVDLQGHSLPNVLAVCQSQAFSGGLTHSKPAGLGKLCANRTGTLCGQLQAKLPLHTVHICTAPSYAPLATLTGLTQPHVSSH